MPRPDGSCGTSVWSRTTRLSSICSRRLRARRRQGAFHRLMARIIPDVASVSVAQADKVSRPVSDGLPATAAASGASRVSGRTATGCGFVARSADLPFRRGKSLVSSVATRGSRRRSRTPSRPGRTAQRCRADTRRLATYSGRGLCCCAAARRSGDGLGVWRKEVCCSIPVQRGRCHVCIAQPAPRRARVVVMRARLPSPGALRATCPGGELRPTSREAARP
ncbi:hypothetical protein SAMN05216338_105934 [Bradyrhizobium sp. Rc2d]|nr:hypothetical protein SAMN05216338_105934 [Bradyrhizobium sp. Rc2d]